MWQLVGAKSGEEYMQNETKEALYRALIQNWPTKNKVVRGKSFGGAKLSKPMPEPMIIRRIK